MLEQSFDNILLDGREIYKCSMNNISANITQLEYNLSHCFCLWELERILCLVYNRRLWLCLRILVKSVLLGNIPAYFSKNNLCSKIFISKWPS